MRLLPCKTEYIGVFSILGGFGEQQKTERKCLPFTIKLWECFWIVFVFVFFSGLHYQLGISLFTDTRSSCIRCYEGISWTICIIWCHWGISCSRWISSRAIYWSVSYKIQKTAVCKVLDRAISASCCLNLLHHPYLQCVKFPESWSKILQFCWYTLILFRVAKKKMDERSFFGSLLHVCYAPEFETVQETREKLQDRRKYIAKATNQRGLW